MVRKRVLYYFSQPKCVAIVLATSLCLLCVNVLSVLERMYVLQCSICVNQVVFLIMLFFFWLIVLSVTARDVLKSSVNCRVSVSP